MHLTTVISFIIALLGALVLVIWMPGRQPHARAAQPGQQAAGNGVAPAEAAGVER
jgi:hypothetical protein